ncbi:MAG: OmpA family protein, partial [Bacteroidota bacterium]
MKLHLILIFLISYTLCLSQSQMAETIYFEVDSYDVTATERSHIDDILEQIKEYDVKKIHLVGHTDSDGSLAYNRKLSERRVQAVREAFVTNGFDSTLIVTKYEGELDPISQNDSDTGKQKNRRVEVLIQYEATTNALANDKDGRIDEGAEAQVFKFSASKGIEFTGKHGTKIRVKPNSLVDSQGREIDGDLLITLKEYYLRCEMMVAGLQTMSNRNVLLETAGMIHVEITLDGTKVELKKREVIDIEMPNEKRLPPMHVFLKEENETTWGPDPTRDWGFFDEDE